MNGRLIIGMSIFMFYCAFALSLCQAKDSGATRPLAAATVEKLFNGKDFTGWSYYLGDTKEKLTDVWSVENGVLKCRGLPRGYLYTTKSDYQDYVLTLQWRWPKQGGNSGVLIHLTGKKNAINVWPQSLEIQLKSEHAGDFWVIGTEIDVEDEQRRVQGRRHINLVDGAEKPVGEWNQLEIVCRGAEVIVRVNGKLANRGTNCSVTSGGIALQSEKTPIEFRNVLIRKL